ncbi:Yip1 family protein [Sphingobium sp. AP49]|uniref:Yip1 family protein n=1 Tax=Sphingobium sp. AP49 TaxID=1144307 RepID=UPI00026EDD3F|nr:Yip1 family protein [Sphingobium sp. AP49]WHO37137.1 Yip1 family protein [Sphingobium sp. AP49]
MSDSNPVSTPPGIVDRAKAIILRPKDEWSVIEAEPASIGGIYTGYAMILAAIPPLATLIGGQLFGHGLFGFSWRPPLIGAIGMAIAHYVLSLIGLAVLAIIINFLAPSFGGQRDKLKAFKISAYSATAGWLAGIFSLIPGLGMLGLLGLYGLYLLYLGLPRLMKVPEQKALPYIIVTLVAGVLLFILASLLAMPFSGLFGGQARPDETGGEMVIPGIGKIDVDKMDAASKQMEQAARRMEEATKNGNAAAIAPDVLQALLPEKIGRFTRTEIESSGMSAGTHASARYQAGEDEIELEVNDIAVAGAFAGIGAALNIQSNKQTANGYERTQTIDGRIVTEEWDKGSRHGKYATTLANRFMIEAEGTAANIDEIKAAVNGLDLDRLTALAAK